MIDMILHHKKWEELLGAYFRNILDDKQEKNFQTVYNKLKELIKNHPCDATKQDCYIFYILLYKLSTILAPKDLVMLAGWLQGIPLQRIYYWTRNDGLAVYPDYLNKECKSSPPYTIDNVDNATFFKEMMPRLETIKYASYLCNGTRMVVIDMLFYHLRNLPDRMLFHRQLVEIKSKDLLSIFKIKDSDKKLYMVDSKTKKLFPHALSAMKVKDIYAELLQYQQPEIQAMAATMKLHPEISSGLHASNAGFFAASSKNGDLAAGQGFHKRI